MKLNLGNKYVQIISFAVLGAAVSYFVTNYTNQKEIRQQETIVAELTGELTTTKNKLGQTLVEKNSALAERDQIKLAYGKDMARIEKEFGIKEKQLLAVIKAMTESHYLGEVDRVDTVEVLIGKDTVTALSASDKTKWLKIDVTLSPNRFKYELHTYDSLTFAFGYEKRKVEGKLFKKNVLLINGKNENPYSRITGLTSFVILDQKPDWLVIGPSAGYGVLIDKNGTVRAGWIIGATATVPMIKIKRPWKK